MMWDDYSGLCVTCDNASTCMYRAIPGRSIFFCEAFHQEPLTSRDAAQDEFELGSPAASNGYQGLCSNCQDRRTCAYPRAEGGVWHCEEYR